MEPAKQNVFTEEKERNVCLSSTESEEQEGKAGLKSEGRNLPSACWNLLNELKNWKMEKKS